MSCSRSHTLFEQAQVVIPGGVNSPVRSFRAVGGTPLFIARGHGARVCDVDDKEYLDYVGSWGPLVLGHANPQVTDVLHQAIELGTSFGAPTEGELILANLISQAIPAMEMVRLVNSGTEATMSALRVARAYTGRSRIVKFAGCYHGHVDGLLVEAGSGAMSHGVPTSAGVPSSYAQETLVAEYNNLASVEHLFEQYPNQIAAVIVEPVAANMGVIPPASGFLSGLKNLTNSQGALLIFDEVITGARIAYGGAQELYGLEADLTCVGKIIGGGLPVGAYGGPRRIMELISPLGPAYQAGTLSGNPIAVAAGITTMEMLREPGVYERLEQLGALLQTNLEEAAQATEIPVTINRVGSILTLFFSSGPINSWEDVALVNIERYATFFHKMLDHGIYLPPSPFEAMFISLAHTAEDIYFTGQCAMGILSEISQ